MKKIFYFELHGDVFFSNSKKEILEAYLLKVPVEAIGDVSIISAHIIEKDFPHEQCNTNRVLLGDIHLNNYWIEKGCAEYPINELLKNSLSDSDVFYELHDEKEFQVKVGLRAC